MSVPLPSRTPLTVTRAPPAAAPVFGSIDVMASVRTAHVRWYGEVKDNRATYRVGSS
jgi:hypothetical protein